MISPTSGDWASTVHVCTTISTYGSDTLDAGTRYRRGGEEGWWCGLMITYVIIIWMIIHTRVVQRLSIHKWEGTRINVVFICPRIAHLWRRNHSNGSSFQASLLQWSSVFIINFRHALGTNTLQAHCRDAERSERLHRE